MDRICNKCGGDEHKPHNRCAFCGSSDMRPLSKGEALPTRMFIGLGPNCWGMGLTPEACGAALLKNWPTFLPHAGCKVQLWDVPRRGAYVNIRGHLCYDPALGDAPRLVIERTI